MSSTEEPIVCPECKAKQQNWNAPCPHWKTELTRERRRWLAEFWNAKSTYDYQKTRRPAGVTTAACRMIVAVDHLESLGAIRPSFGLPTLDQVDGYAPRGMAWITPFQLEAAQDEQPTG